MRFDTFATLLALTLPYAASGNCNICGEGGRMGNIDAVAYIDPSSGDEVLCSAASAEQYDEMTCSFVTASAFSPCECDGVAPTQPHPICNICGDNNEMSVDALDEVAFTGEGSSPWSCREASSFGGLGLLSEDLCRVVHFSAHTPCQCSGERGVLEHPVCNICGGDSEVGNYDGAFIDPDIDETSCRTASTYGLAGFIEQNYCGLLPFYAFESCSCSGVAPEPACNICGDGNTIQNMSGIINEGSEEVFCRDVYNHYLTNEVDDDTYNDAQCSLVVSQSFDPCGCTGEKPVEELYTCNICEDGYEITNYDATAIKDPITGLPVSCNEMSDIGAGSNLTETQCSFVRSQASIPCGCTMVTEPTPQATAQPTPQPTQPDAFITKVEKTNGAFVSGMNVLQSILFMCASIVFMY